MSSAITLFRGDITQVKVEAIVNAAKQSLLGGGGVDGAIHRAAGPQLLEACRLLNGCETGDAKITPGFKLSASYVIHTVGPVWKGGAYGEDDLLRLCYTRSLELALKHKIRSIAFPNISTGVYGFPKERAAKIAVMTVIEFLKRKQVQLEVIFALFDSENENLYSTLLEK